MMVHSKFYIITIIMTPIMMMLTMMENYSNSAMIINISTSSMSEFMTSVYISIDLYSILFLSMVMMISGLVMLYSSEYMSGDLMKKSFHMMMIMFICSMIMMSLSSSMFWLMIGWDGLGLSSFCLIMYFKNWKSFNSAMITFMSNRIGDLFLLSSIWWMITFSTISSWSVKQSLILSLMISMVAFSKSAQMPFCHWLPLAMAAPTPVSSLVHSSTLITAGVYVLIRFEKSIEYKELIMLISMATIMLASTSSIWEYDIKKIIALSTLSHIGLMILLISMGNKEPAMMHLMMHASFKSSLFMTAGMLIHNNFNNQDIRSMFMPIKLNPKLSLLLMINIMSMTGLPFLSGFYSKDIMILSTPESFTKSMGLLSMLVCVLLTCMYSSRMLMFMMKSSKLSSTLVMERKMNKMEAALTLGTIMSIMIGGALSWFMFPKEINIDMSLTSVNSKSLLVLMMIMGTSMGCLSATISPSKIKLISMMMNNMWFINSFTMMNSNKLFKVSQLLMFQLDNKGWMSFNIKMMKKEMNNMTTGLMKMKMTIKSMKVMIMVATMTMMQMM